MAWGLSASIWKNFGAGICGGGLWNDHEIAHLSNSSHT